MVLRHKTKIVHSRNEILLKHGFMRQVKINRFVLSPCFAIFPVKLRTYETFKIGNVR